MKSFLLFLFLPLVVLSQSLKFDDLDQTIESKTSTEKKEAYFTFTNSSNELIKFEKIKASCGCVLVEFPEEVKPGKSAKITFKAPIPYGGGKYTKFIYVHTNEKEGVNYTLKFTVINTDPYVPRTSKNVDFKLNPKKEKNEIIPYLPSKGYIRPQRMTKRTLLVEKLKAKQALARKKSYYSQEECPFLPLPINKKLFHDFDGMRIYTCCEQCLVLVKESPYHAIIKLAEKTQTPSLIKDIKLEENK